ncbi:threonine/serine exporter family protein [Pullulanibacillus camelliae]|uniref:threonine/serine exporter family protein n=1 Tax=Pullulanibacillus camelliae TaxID=1707096 RepID=UPI001665BA6B|nr:threonine/serine exporter family protein [Pullulanibacillus camelliae]
MLQQCITSFIASAAFGIIFNCPKNALVKCGLVGMMGWLMYILLVAFNVNVVLANLLAAFFIAVIGQSFARMYKMPMIIFSVAGIIPLVPGGMAYDAMRHFVQNDYSSAVQLSAKVFLLSGAIAVGLILSEVSNQMYRKLRSLKQGA